MPQTSRFDESIKISAEQYLPDWDWRLYRALLMAESGLDPEARSRAGARGIAQFMPRTWLEVTDALGVRGEPEAPGLAIPAGAYYLARQWDIWTAPRPVQDRICLAMASYNAGAGSLLRAQRVVGGKNLYSEIIQGLPDVTGHHARETITYVQRIWRYYVEMLTGD